MLNSPTLILPYVDVALKVLFGYCCTNVGINFTLWCENSYANHLTFRNLRYRKRYGPIDDGFLEKLPALETLMIITTEIRD